MPKFIKEVEAVQFNSQEVADKYGFALKQDGSEVFGLGVINHASVKVNEGDYLVVEDGKVVAVVGKEVFESEHTEVAEAIAEAVAEAHAEETPQGQSSQDQIQ